VRGAVQPRVGDALSPPQLAGNRYRPKQVLKVGSGTRGRSTRGIVDTALESTGDFMDSVDEGWDHFDDALISCRRLPELRLDLRLRRLYLCESFSEGSRCAQRRRERYPVDDARLLGDLTFKGTAVRPPCSLAVRRGCGAPCA
jgi:hypothetical protein